MTQNEYCAKLWEKAGWLIESFVIWMLYHPCSAVTILFVVVFVLPRLPELGYHWGVMAFYPGRFDYSSVCIGGGCP